MSRFIEQPALTSEQILAGLWSVNSSDQGYWWGDEAAEVELTPTPDVTQEAPAISYVEEASEAAPFDPFETSINNPLIQVYQEPASPVYDSQRSHTRQIKRVVIAGTSQEHARDRYRTYRRFLPADSEFMTLDPEKVEDTTEPKHHDPVVAAIYKNKETLKSKEYRQLNALGIAVGILSSDINFVNAAGYVTFKPNTTQEARQHRQLTTLQLSGEDSKHPLWIGSMTRAFKDESGKEVSRVCRFAVRMKFDRGFEEEYIHEGYNPRINAGIPLVEESEGYLFEVADLDEVTKDAQGRVDLGELEFFPITRGMAIGLIAHKMLPEAALMVLGELGRGELSEEETLYARSFISLFTDNEGREWEMVKIAPFLGMLTIGRLFAGEKESLELFQEQVAREMDIEFVRQILDESGTIAFI